MVFDRKKKRMRKCDNKHKCQKRRVKNKTEKRWKDNKKITKVGNRE